MCVSWSPRASMRKAVFVSSFQNVAFPVCAASVPFAESMRWNHATPPVPRKAAFQVSGEENSHEGSAFHAAVKGEGWLCSIRQTIVLWRTVKSQRSLVPLPRLMPLKVAELSVQRTIGGGASAGVEARGPPCAALWMPMAVVTRPVAPSTFWPRMLTPSIVHPVA